MRHTNSKGVLFKTLHTAAEISLCEDAPLGVWTCAIAAAHENKTGVDPVWRLLALVMKSDRCKGAWTPEKRCLMFLMLAEYVKTDSLYGYRAAQAEKHVQKLRNASFK